MGVLTLPGRLVGGLVRSVHHGASELDPVHRRDGLGFLLLATAAVVGAGGWFGVDGVAVSWVHQAVAGVLGRTALVLPLVLLALSLRLFRRPDAERENGRIGIGLLALGAAASSLLHVLAGLPAPTDGWPAMRAGGGLVGFLVATPLVQAVSVWLAVPVLVLLALFGLLVVTATPLHQVTDRLRDGFTRLTRRHPDVGLDDDGDPVRTGAHGADVPRRRGLRGRRPAPADDEPVGTLSDGDVIPIERTNRNPEVEEVLSAMSLLLNGGGIAQLGVIERELNNALRGNTDEIQHLIGELNTFIGR